MNLRKPDFDDELGESIRQTLRQQTDTTDPPLDIWPYIQTELEMNPPAKVVRRKWFVSLSPPLSQALSILLIMIAGSLVLHPSFTTERETPILTAQVSPYGGGFNAETYFDEYSLRVHSREFQQELEQQRLRNNASITAQDLSAINTPVLVVPLDKIPNPTGPERWLINSDKPEGASDPIIWQINQVGYMVRSGLIQ
jgi:hypothetical protein